MGNLSNEMQGLLMPATWPGSPPEAFNMENTGTFISSCHVLVLAPGAGVYFVVGEELERRMGPVLLLLDSLTALSVVLASSASQPEWSLCSPSSRDILYMAALSTVLKPSCRAALLAIVGKQ